MYKAIGERVHVEQRFNRNNGVSDKTISVMDIDEPCCKSSSSVQQGN